MLQSWASIADVSKERVAFTFTGSRSVKLKATRSFITPGRAASRISRRRRRKNLRTRISYLAHAGYVSRFSHSTWLGIRCREIIPFLLMQLLPSSSFCLFSVSKYSPRHTILFILILWKWKFIWIISHKTFTLCLTVNRTNNSVDAVYANNRCLLWKWNGNT